MIMAYGNFPQREPAAAMISKVPNGTVGAGDESQQHNLKHKTSRKIEARSIVHPRRPLN